MVLCFYLNINWEEIIKWHLNSSLTVFLNTIKHRFLHWLWEFANFIKRSSFYKFIYRNLELSIVKHTPIECEGWRRHSSLIFLILLFTKPNIEVSGWLYQTKTHFTHIVYQPFSRVSPPSFTLYDHCRLSQSFLHCFCDHHPALHQKQLYKNDWQLERGR